MNILFIRATRKFNSLAEEVTDDSPQMRIQVSFIRRGGEVRDHKLTIKAAKALKKRLERLGWNIRPAITGPEIGWTAKPWSHIGLMKYLRDYQEALTRARAEAEKSRKAKVREEIPALSEAF
jgi:chromatin segregation and condensation protein Rec8/ScpA/Scc1 (kleisin family)